MGAINFIADCADSKKQYCLLPKAFGSGFYLFLAYYPNVEKGE